MNAWRGEVQAPVQGVLQNEVEAVPDLPTTDVAIERLADSCSVTLAYGSDTKIRIIGKLGVSYFISCVKRHI